MIILGASVERFLPHSREKVAGVIHSPASIVNWHPWIERTCLYVKGGLVYRKAVFTGGSTELVEKYWSDEDESEFHFQAVQGLWADYRYRSRLKLEECADGCRLLWEGRFMKETAEDESERMEDFYREGLRGLDDLLDEL